MKTTSTAGICVISILLLTGCTIEKRLFQKGYHIEWKKKTPKMHAKETVHQLSGNNIEPDSITHSHVTDIRFLENEARPPETPTKPGPTGNHTESVALTDTTDALLTDQSEKRKPVEQATPKKGTDLREMEHKKRFELFGVMSFGLYFCSIAFAIVGIVLLDFPFLFVIAGSMILVSLCFGIISVIRYRRNRSEYRKNPFGYFGLIASIATISFIGALLLLAWGVGSF